MYRALRWGNSLFGRLAALSISLLILTQATWLMAIEHERGQVEADHMSRLIHFAVPDDGNGRIERQRLASVLGFRFIDPPETTQTGGETQDLVARGCPAPCSGTDGVFESRLRAKLPADSRVVVDPVKSVVWVRYGAASPWMVIPIDVPGAGRLLGVNASMLLIAICVALIGAWQIQQPLLRLARAARELRLGHRPPVVGISGPSEIKELIGDFNEMARDLSDAEQERAVMLAGVAHDLRAPLARIQVRANLLDDMRAQSGFLRDAASLSQIVTQFLDFARDVDAEQHAPRVAVDTFCRSQYAQPDDDTREPLIELDLAAGPGFMLPSVELDRMLSNLIENAFVYGAPPLRIRTGIRGQRHVLSVCDRGPGMPEADFDRALRPFVRLDPARGGESHCGLGLTIVRRLARRYGGDMALANAAEGGLCVTLSFPAAGGAAGKPV
ncbi:MAG: ATP-binding protein [Janthinobacterium lividum]